MAALAKLFSETPHAQRKQDERDDEEAYKIGPEMHEPASFEQNRARDDSEVVNRVDDAQGLQPLRHRFHGS